MPTRKLLCKTIISETIGIVLSQYLSRANLVSSCCPPLMNMMFHIHQNLLLICDAILEKISSESTFNLVRLQSILNEKRWYKVINKNYWTLIEINNETIACLFQTITKSIESNKSFLNQTPLLTCITNILSDMDKYRPYHARELLLKAIKESV